MVNDLDRDMRRFLWDIRKFLITGEVCLCCEKLMVRRRDGVVVCDMDDNEMGLGFLNNYRCDFWVVRHGWDTG